MAITLLGASIAASFLPRRPSTLDIDGAETASTAETSASVTAVTEIK
jgi:hypothetical protein